MEEEDKSPEQIARDLSRRYGGRAAVRYTGDMNEIPQRLLMPSVHDASLWQVRVRVSNSSFVPFFYAKRHMAAWSGTRHRLQSHA
jgi:transcription elongation factor SPT5